MNGTLEDTTPAGVLQVLSSQRSTGAVRFLGGSGCTVYLYEGELYFAENSETAEDLAVALVRPDRLTAAQWDAATDAGYPTETVGEQIIANGTVGRDLLASVVLSIIYDPLITLFRAPEGDYEFAPDVMHWIGPYRSFSVDAIVAEVRRRTREADEMAPVVPSLEAIVRSARTLPENHGSVTLRRDDWEVIVAAASGCTIAGLAAELGRGRWSTARIVYRLATADLLMVSAADSAEGYLGGSDATDRSPLMGFDAADAPPPLDTTVLAPDGGHAFGDTSFGDTSFGDTSFSDTSFSDTSFSDTSFSDTSFSDTAFGGDAASDNTSEGEATSTDDWGLGPTGTTTDDPWSTSDTDTSDTDTSNTGTSDTTTDDPWSTSESGTSDTGTNDTGTSDATSDDPWGEFDATTQAADSWDPAGLFGDEGQDATGDASRGAGLAAVPDLEADRDLGTDGDLGTEADFEPPALHPDIAKALAESTYADSATAINAMAARLGAIGSDDDDEDDDDDAWSGSGRSDEGSGDAFWEADDDQEFIWKPAAWDTGVESAPLPQRAATAHAVSDGDASAAGDPAWLNSLYDDFMPGGQSAAGESAGSSAEADPDAAPKQRGLRRLLRTIRRL